MSLGNTFENDLAKLLFQGAAIANIADNAASSPLTSLYLSLHTSDPGEGGDQTTNEISYTGYARVAVARTSGGFSISANVVSLVADAVYGKMTGGSGGTVTHCAIGTASTGTGKLLASGTVTPNLNVVTGVKPVLDTGTTFTID